RRAGGFPETSGWPRTSECALPPCASRLVCPSLRSLRPLRTRDFQMSGDTASMLPQAITLEALESGFAAITGQPPGAAEKAFLAQVLEDYAGDETPELDSADLAALLAAVWRSSLDHEPGGAALISVGPHTGAR